MASPKFDFYSRPEYFADLTERVSRTKKSDTVTLMTMVFEPQVPGVGRLMEALYKAAARGVDIRLIVDAHSFLIDESGRLGPLFYGRKLSGHLREPFAGRFASLEQLRLNGGRYWIINKPTRAFTNPVAGRSHIKLALINNRVYLGGCNFDDENQTDLMVGWNDDKSDAKTAAWLRKLTEKIIDARSVKRALRDLDLKHNVNDSLAILVDSGVKRQSFIYQQALNFIDEASKEVFIACQFFPGGPTVQHLLSAQKRGAEVTILFNGPSAHRQPLGQHLYNLRERRRVPASFFKDQLPPEGPKLHAKLIATEHGAILGSHNFINIGVNLGTAEIALLNRDPGFAQKTIEAIPRQLA